MITTLWLLACGGPAESVPLSAAAATRAGAMTVTDGAIDVSTLGAHDWDCSQSKPTTIKGGSPCVEQHFYVAPIRGQGTTEGPVQAWATCRSSFTTADACRAHLAAVTAVTGKVSWRYDPGHASGWLEAIRASGLPSADDAPVILVD